MWSAIALTVLIAASSPTQQRVELVAKLETSVAVITAESRELRHRRNEVVVDRGEVIGWLVEIRAARASNRFSGTSMSDPQGAMHAAHARDQKAVGARKRW